MPSKGSPHSRGWIWFFVVLIILVLIAIPIPVWYNFSQQLTLEQLEAAKAKWREKGPSDYDMEYTFKKLDSTETYVVQVRNRKVISVFRDGQPQEERLYRYADMPALYDFLEDFLERDTQPDSPRTFAI